MALSSLQNEELGRMISLIWVRLGKRHGYFSHKRLIKDEVCVPEYTKSSTNHILSLGLVPVGHEGYFTIGRLESPRSENRMPTSVSLGEGQRKILGAWGSTNPTRSFRSIAQNSAK